MLVVSFGGACLLRRPRLGYNSFLQVCLCHNFTAWLILKILGVGTNLRRVSATSLLGVSEKWECKVRSRTMKHQFAKDCESEVF